MNETIRTSRRKGRRQIGAATFSSLPRSNRLQFSNRQILLVELGLTCCKQTVEACANRKFSRGAANFYFQISDLGDSIRIAVPSERREPRDQGASSTSTRQDFQVEIAVSHSKQRIGAPATRQFSWGSPAQTSVKPRQLFSPVSHSKQTIETQIKCQFFAMCFFPCRQHPECRAELRLSARREVLRLPSVAQDDDPISHTQLTVDLGALPYRIVILPTGLALDYDSARSAAEGGFFGRVKKNDRRSPGPAKVHPMMCGSLFQHACPSAMAPSTIAVRTEFLARIRKQIPRRPDRGLARDDNEIRMI
jgi:hypothetical protein